ncbi:MAG TPA: ParA family protein [Chloroflexi bacterium]|nr:ParA family protein [Chloroflexota bacterium]
MSGTWKTPQPEDTGEATVLIAAPPARLNVWGPALSDDPRLRVVSVATTPDDLAAKLAAHPHALLLDGTVFPGPKELLDFLGGVQVDAYVVLPPEGADAVPQVQAFPTVKAAYVGDIDNLKTLTDTIVANAQAAVLQDGAIWNASRGGNAVAGFKSVAVWNQAGGVGKTTVASNLAAAAAQRGVPTLLIGLGAPDDLALIMGLKPRPNITEWLANPTADGLKEAIQKRDNLDVLAGFPDVLSEARLTSLPADAPSNIPNLVTTAAYMGYGLVVIDAPPSSLAANAIAAANTLVLVARPSLEGVLRAVEAYRTVTERLAGRHRITATGVHVVLNRTGNRLSTQEWHAAASDLLGRGFPPVLAEIPDLPAVGRAQDARQLPIAVSAEFARALNPLVSALAPAGSNGNGRFRRGKEYRFLGIKVRV